MPVNTKATPGSSRTPKNNCPTAGTRSVGVSRGPARKHLGAAPSLNATVRVVQASGSVRNRVAGVVSIDQKQPTCGRSEDTGRRNIISAPSTIALATFMCSILPETTVMTEISDPGLSIWSQARVTDLTLQTVCLEVPSFAPTVPLLAR